MSWVLEASMAKVMSPKPNSAVVTQRSRAPRCDGVFVGISMAKVIPDFSRCASEKCRLVGTAGPPPTRHGPGLSSAICARHTKEKHHGFWDYHRDCGRFLEGRQTC